MLFTKSLFLFSLFFSSFAFSRMSVSPGNMGPRALPIQPVGRVKIDKTTYTDVTFMGSIELEQELSYSPQIDFFIPWNDFVAVLVKIEPFELYNMSKALQAERGTDGRHGIALGDLYFGSDLFLFRNKNEKFELHLNFLTKTSIGKGRENSRHTDAPAYQIDIRFRKKMTWLKEIPLMPEELLGYTGLLTWQTGSDHHNEAFCWALKAVYGAYDVKIAIELGGYAGWQYNDDRPLMGAFEITKIFDHFNMFARYQYGFRDQVAHSMMLGVSYKYIRPRFF